MALPSSYNGLVRGGEDTCDGLPPLPSPADCGRRRGGEGREREAGESCQKETVVARSGGWEKGVVVSGVRLAAVNVETQYSPAAAHDVSHPSTAQAGRMTPVPICP